MELSNLLAEEPARAPRRSQPKTIAFELLLDEGSKTRARIPLRILVNPHDTTDSIITTVKNFYGIYDGHGVTFEDVHGNILIARYENLAHNSVVYVRTVAGPSQPMMAPGSSQYQPIPNYEPQRRSSLGEPFQMAPPNTYEQSRSPSRSASRLARKRSASPPYGRGRRSASQQKPEIFPASRGSSVNGSYNDDAANGYSDSDAGRSSVTGSKKARSEQFASAEISVENVLPDGRRMNSFFDSSVLPLFVPPQVPIPTSTSSISPQRRSLPQDGPSPFHPPAYNIHSQQTQSLLSPQSHGFSGQALDFGTQNQTSQSVTRVPPHGHRLRDRGSAQPSVQATNGRAAYSGQGVLPTPDPTVASCISDEDVARQLIALGDMSNFSHGRTSNSTLDDTFSGAADAASSTGATSDSEVYSDDDHRLPKQRRLNDDEDQEYENDAIIKSEMDDYEGEPKTKKVKTKVHDGPSTEFRVPRAGSSTKSSKGSKHRANTLPKVSKSSGHTGLMKAPTAPATPGLPRKTSSSSSTLNFQHHLRMEEEDLSSKPRCQRCRKSKKGCDRQRPCQRCKDAGLGIDDCVSEDEGNGRKGRYGRHMGVIVKKSGEVLVTDDDDDSQLAGAILTDMASADTGLEKSKKRKR